MTSLSIKTKKQLYTALVVLGLLPTIGMLVWGVNIARKSPEIAQVLYHFSGTTKTQ